jgi:hypothetical protein
VEHISNLELRKKSDSKGDLKAREVRFWPFDATNFEFRQQFPCQID